MNNKTDLLEFLGVKLKDNFFDEEFCDLLVNLMDRSENREKGKIDEEDNSDGLYDEETRNTFVLHMPRKIRTQIRKRIMTELKPELEQFFDIPLTGIQPLEFLFYEKGHFFHPHRDEISSLGPKNQRRISVVIFLNQQVRKQEQSNSYGGGSLNLYGLSDLSSKKGFSIKGNKGRLVAFRSNVVHEVTPIEWGKRYSLVIWFSS